MFRFKILIFFLFGSAISNAFVIETEEEGLPDSFYDVCKEDFSNCVGAWGRSSDEPGHPCLEHKNCTTIIAFEEVDDHYVFYTMTELVDDKEYVALGFSLDTGMGDDGVVECIIDNATEAKPINTYLSYNEGHSTVRSANQNGLEEIEAKIENNYLYCKFNLTNSLNFNDMKVSLAGDEEYYLIGVSGVTKKAEDNVTVIGVGRHHNSRLVSDKPLFRKGENQLPDSFYDVCKEDFSNCVGAWGKSSDEPGHPCLEHKNCTTIIAFEEVDDHYVFHTMTELVDDKEYVALGFSLDTGMGNDGVVECIIDNVTEAKPISTYLSYNEGHSTIRSANQNGLEEIEAKIENNYLYCKFNLNNSLNFNDMKVSLAGDEEYYLIGVSGVTKKDENGAVVGVGRHRNSRLVSDKPLFKKGGDENELPNSFYDVCNENSSNCLGAYFVDEQPELSCVEHRNCTLIVAYEKVDNHYVFHTMTELGNNIGYVALGLSEDQKMADDGVVECIKDNKQDKPVNIYLSVTNHEDKGVSRLDNKNGVEEIVAKEENNYIYCKFNLTNSLDFGNLKVSLTGDKEYYLMAAAGKTNTGADGSVNIGFHTAGKLTSENKLFKDNSADDPGVGAGSTIVTYFTLICACLVFIFSC